MENKEIEKVEKFSIKYKKHSSKAGYLKDKN